MRTASASDVRRILRTHGQRGWVELTLKYGRTFRQGGLVLTCEPDAVRALLMDRHHAVKRPPVHRLMGQFPGADGIVFMDGDPWLARTRALAPTFHQRNIDAYPGWVHETTLAHLARWRRQERVPDLYEAVQQLDAAAILRIGYGLDPGDPAAIRLMRTMVGYKQLMTRPQRRHRLDELGLGASKLLALPWILLGLGRLWMKTRDVRRTLRGVLDDGRMDSERPDWIRGLREAGIDGRELAEDLNHLYTAYNAIDYALTAALYELARDRALAETLRAEIVSVLDREPPTRHDLPRLRLTHAFMLEVLRRYPVTMGAARLTGAPLTIDGETIPAGTQVIVLLHALHHHPDFWDEPWRLKPERWLAAPAPRVPFSYVPFLDGSRKCIGRALAEMQMLVQLTTIVRRVDLTVHREAVVPPFMIPRFAGPIPFSAVAAEPAGV